MDVLRSSESLHEFIDADFPVQGISDPTRRAKLMTTVQQLDGIRASGVSGGKLFVTYEPVTVTLAEILDAIRSAGFQVGEVESSSASPVADALDQVVMRGTTFPESESHESGNH